MKSAILALAWMIIVTISSACSFGGDDIQEPVGGEDDLQQQQDQDQDQDQEEDEFDQDEGDENLGEEGNEGNSQGDENQFGEDDEDLGQQGEGEQINSDVENDFIDEQVNNQGILDNNQGFQGNENLLSEENAANFDGQFPQQNNQGFPQNEGQGQFQQDQFLQGQNQQLLNQQFQGEQGLDGQQDGEGINNATENDFLAQDEQTDFNQGALDNSVNEVVDGAATSGGRVKYVRSGGSSLYDRPNGSKTEELEQGDHPLVFSEGEWARTSDGYYVPNRDLTDSPVPRVKRRIRWQN